MLTPYETIETGMKREESQVEWLNDQGMHDFANPLKQGILTEPRSDSVSAEQIKDSLFLSEPPSLPVSSYSIFLRLFCFPFPMLLVPLLQRTSEYDTLQSQPHGARQQVHCEEIEEG
jgi:hypothetical protein